ncbi:hypothetical protein NS14008_18630 [Nocardia seriolae]|nr:hypothetical protein NS14008_18630 [Nocardia seriolae]BAW06974.1 conserved hypothetical protein [Nocardia seriolae]
MPIGLRLAGAAAAALYLLYQLPIWLARDELRDLDAKDRLAAAAALRGQFVPVLSAGLALVGVVYTARKYFLDRDKQTIDRFNTAVSHLDSDNPVTRAGGVWALEGIMADSPRDRDRCRRTLAYYVREHTRTGGSGTDGPPGDIAAALDVLRNARLAAGGGAAPLDLAGLRVPRADLHAMPWAAAQLTRADLTGAHARGIDLTGADLEQATLIDADLRDANLTAANLRGVRLGGADLRGADLRRAIGCTRDQLAVARTDPGTRLPADLEP